MVESSLLIADRWFSLHHHETGIGTPSRDANRVNPPRRPMSRAQSL